MSANVESMFYVREVPWHGLGTRVEEALCSEDALVKSGLNWNVVQKDVHVDGVIANNYKANVRDIDNSILGIVTNRYQIVQNKDAFNFTDALLGMNVKYETAGSLAKGKKVWMLAKMPETKILGEEYIPYLVFTNSHDGTGAIKVAITPVRVVCQNTLNLALESAKRHWSTKHMGNMEFKMEEAKRTLELANNYLGAFKINAVELANQSIDNAMLEEFIDKMFPLEADATNRKTSNINVIRNNFRTCYASEDLKQFQGTAYGLINAISDMVTHSKPLRASDTYQEKLFDKVIDGHGVIDDAYKLIYAMR